jgi:hypothetical protein
MSADGSQAPLPTLGSLLNSLIKYARNSNSSATTKDIRLANPRRKSELFA